MKSISRICIPLSLLFLVFAVSCSDPPDAKETFVKKLSKKWKPSSNGVAFNGQAVNGVFDTFTVTFAKGLTYTTTDGQQPVWRLSGKFTLKRVQWPVGFSLLRDDGVEIIVQELTDQKLVLKFDFTSSGRLRSVSGGYVFDLIPG